MITQSKLKSIFVYHEDGCLIRQINSKAITYINPKGYVEGKVLGKNQLIHRMIFLFHHGYLPEQVDHKDGNRANNRIKNLRPATNSLNQRNSKKNKNNTSGFKGVYQHKTSGKYKAQIRANSNPMHLGYFDTPEEAHQAYCKASVKYHGKFGRTE